MNFKLSRITALVGLAFVATASFADPQSPNRAPANYTTGTSDIYLAGSSAIDLALTKFIANTCAAGSLDTYRTDAGGRTYYLWTCESAPSANFKLGSNTRIAIHKNTNSSSDGTNLVTNAGGTLAFLQPADLTASAGACNVAPKSVAATSTIPAYKEFNCGTTVGAAGVPPLSHTVTFGFSDSEPKQFNATAAGEVTSSFPLTIVFGVPVTKNVRDLLQTAQGLTAGDESEAGMPSLTSAQVNSIFTGRFTTWANLGITVPVDNKIYLIRRSGGSGTTRAFDATFVTDICVPGATAIVSATTLVTSTIATQCNATASAGTQKLQAGTSDDVASCLNSYQSNGNVGAIAYLSTDYTPATADGYRWIKVDGHSPKLLNVADGKWNDWSEESLNYNTAAGIANDDLAFYNAIQATSTNGTLMSEIAQNLPQTTSGLWTGGVMGALPGRQNTGGFGLAAGASLTLPRTDASVLAYPANPMTRGTSQGYKLCSVPQPAVGYAAQ